MDALTEMINMLEYKSLKLHTAVVRLRNTRVGLRDIESCLGDLAIQLDLVRSTQNLLEEIPAERDY